MILYNQKDLILKLMYINSIQIKNIQQLNKVCSTTLNLIVLKLKSFKVLLLLIINVVFGTFIKNYFHTFDKINSF